MSAVYSDAWYDDLKNMIDNSAEFAAKAPTKRLVMTLEINGDGTSPYVAADSARYYVIVLEAGKVVELHSLDDRHDGDGLSFRFSGDATVWEEIAAGLRDPITAGLKGKLRIRGDMRFLMQNAEAVKILVDLYSQQVHTEWPQGKPPYA